MKILRIINRLAIGGPLWNVYNLTRHMGGFGDTLLVAGTRESHEEDGTHLFRDENIEPLIIPEMGRSIHPLQDFLAYRSLRKIIRKFQPDIVHTHAAKPGALGRLAARAEGVPVIVHTFHGHVFHSYFSPMKNRVFLGVERYLAQKTDAIIAISPEQKRELSEEFRIAAADKFRVIPLGFDLDRFSEDQSSKRASFRKEMGVDEDTVIITLTGRLVPIKNHVFFLKVFCRVKQLINKKVLAVFVGDGESRPVIVEEAKKLGIMLSCLGEQHAGTDLILTSWRTDIDVINAGSDIIALTSLNEGTPVSLIEASAAGRPVVSTRVGGVESVVLEGRTGYLTERDDVETFSDRLVHLIENPTERLEFGRAGAAHVRSKFTYQRLVSDMAELYHELLERKKR